MLTVGTSASIVTLATVALVTACENCERAIWNILASWTALGVKVISSMPPLNISLKVVPLNLPPMRNLYAEFVVNSVTAPVQLSAIVVSWVPFWKYLIPPDPKLNEI